MTNRATGRSTFRISPGGIGGNTKAVGQETDDERVVLNKVKSGWSVRAATRNRSREGLFAVGRRAIKELVVVRPDA